MKILKLLTRLSLLTALAVVLLLVKTGSAHAATDYTNSRLMDDQIFDNANSMNEAAIQNFLNGSDGRVSGGSPCLKSYTSMNFHWDGQDWNYGDGTRVGNTTGWQLVSSPWNNAWGPATVPSWTIIYQAAQVWNNLGPGGVNPQVILSTLQKEESLVTGTDCAAWRYNSAMGYACPDSGGCNPKYAGFTKQVLWATWQLAFNRHRAVGQTSWDGDDGLTYSGIMTQGTYKRCGTCSANFYDGYATIDGTSVYMSNATTASLYTYTPHLGNSTPVWFEQWFGPATVAAYSWQPVSTTYSRGNNYIPATEKETITVVAKNIGTQTWYNGTGSPVVKMGTYDPAHPSQFYDASWPDRYREAVMQEASVAPGATGTFTFTIQAPAQGNYNERFNLIAEGTAWFADPGFTIPFQVGPAGFSAQYVSDTIPATMSADSTVTVTIKNNSYTTWYKTGSAPIRLGTYGHNSVFADSSWPSPNRAANMNEDSVAAGANATFTFVINSPTSPGTYSDNFQPVAEGWAWIPGSFTKTITVPAAYGWQPVSTTYSRGNNYIPSTEKETITVVAKNTGTQTWHNGTGSPVVKMGTYDPNHPSLFYDPSWPDRYREAVLQEATVAPGSNGTFSFTVQAPAPGNYSERFNLVAENTAWFMDPAFTVPFQVGPAGFNSQFVSDNFPTSMPAGSTASVTVTYKNLSNTNWYKSGDAVIKLGTYGHNSLFAESSWESASRAATMNENTVTGAGSAAGPGNVSFTFIIKAPSAPGAYTESFEPVVEGWTWIPVQLTKTITVN